MTEDVGARSCGSCVGGSRWHLRPARVLQVAAVLVAIQLLVRTWVAARSDFYWDDLILAGRGGSLPLLSGDLLLYDHDGHLMPGAFVVAGIATRLAPYQWILPMLTVIALQAMASYAVFRLLRTLLGLRPVMLVPLALYLFSPLTVPAFAWWAAALNALPLQIGLAWVTGDALKLCRTGRRRYAISGTLVLVASLLFFEKSVVVPFVAFATVALLAHIAGRPRPVRSTLSRGAGLWIPSAAVLAVWAAIYFSTVASRWEWAGTSRAVELLHHSTSLGLLPTFVGGPWTWDRWIPSPPWATPSTALEVVGWVVLVAAVAATVRLKRRIGWVWILAAAYFLLSVTAMVVTRWGADTTYELAQTLRYFTDTAVILAIAVALIARAPRRRADPVRVRPPVVVAVVVAFVASSLWSTFTFTRSWEENPTTDYLATARASLADRSDAPILEQPTSFWVLLPVAYPNNLVSRVLAPLRDRPAFSDSTPDLRMIDDAGKVVDAQVTWVRSIEPGTVPDCGHLVDRRTFVPLPLDGPLTGWEWTVQLNYLADADGEIAVAMEVGNPVRVPVHQGPNSVFVRLTGGGRNVRVSTLTRDLSLCVGVGPVGVVVPK
ncbi:MULTISPECIES: hypothetical protein [unclassified Rhodococcus (in: high G+C Gram-positive bacteria)]|uniref:hypothetical protein n=1 Tax=unclassified Rhodococcus (in: high G+C Gram-positive bacteria) TaxID=192944 RepID=UPI00163A3580|nr:MULTISPECIES: hypothetical protein [unclassified Rhodococcus (in: high G+C Gram-positive bacteria)]MBC2641376.1 hypothetical protein [Rhodococcus sp. 3A]MBC2893879.1 hypothetical protein [Rhodococcus sp. 4CII]